MTTVCTKCLVGAPMPRQRWCKECFRRYRQTARAKQREARQKAKTVGIPTTGPVQPEAPAQMESPSPPQPPLRLIVRFGPVRLCLLPAQEDVAVLKRLDSGPHQGLVFIQREKR